MNSGGAAQKLKDQIHEAELKRLEHRVRRLRTAVGWVLVSQAFIALGMIGMVLSR